MINTEIIKNNFAELIEICTKGKQVGIHGRSIFGGVTRIAQIQFNKMFAPI